MMNMRKANQLKRRIRYWESKLAYHDYTHLRRVCRRKLRMLRAHLREIESRDTARLRMKGRWAS